MEGAPPKIQELDHLIAFTVTMIHWALNNMKGGPQTDFETAVYGRHYRDDVHHMEDIRKRNYGTELQCLNHLTHCIVQHRREIVDHCM